MIVACRSLPAKSNDCLAAHCDAHTYRWPNIIKRFDTALVTYVTATPTNNLVRYRQIHSYPHHLALLDGVVTGVARYRMQENDLVC